MTHPHRLIPKRALRRACLIAVAAAALVLTTGCGRFKAKAQAKAPAPTAASTSELEGSSAEKDGADLGGRAAEGRERLLRDNGGTAASEAAVVAGLEWLAAHQAANGHWSLDGYHQDAKCNCAGFGRKNDVAGTALGLLPFLAAGETHRGNEQSARYTKLVERGIAFLIKAQKSDGNFGGGMYAHGLATIALCEDFCMTADPTLHDPCQKAVDFIIKAQHAAGGWRYQPTRQPGDTSVSSWQLMALKSGQMCGLSVPKRTLENATLYLKSAAAPTDDGYAYLPRQKPTPAMTAAGLLCRQYLQGNDLQSAHLTPGIERLKKHPPTQQLHNMYYYYYATQVMFNMGGDAWQSWNPKMRDLLIDWQDKGNDSAHAHQKGSWQLTKDRWGQTGGRVMTTSFALLTLEVYYRHLPLYRRNLGDMLKPKQ
jgi:hypothetical protein